MQLVVKGFNDNQKDMDADKHAGRQTEREMH